jgi:hypothetical protein
MKITAFEILQSKLTIADTFEFREKHIPEILEAMEQYATVSKMEIAELSDKEIRKAAIEYANNVYDKNDFKDEWRGVLNDFIAATKWYREQLKSKQ